MNRKVTLGEGRVVEVKAGATAPADALAPCGRGTPKNPRTKKRRKVRTKLTKQTLFEKPKRVRVKTPKRLNPREQLSKTVPGYDEWFQRRLAQMAQFRNKLGFPSWLRLGVIEGMTKKSAAKAWAEAKRKAKNNMAALQKAGLLSDDEIANEATEMTLTVMRGPANLDTKLKAAGQLLNFYKAKPVQRVENKIDAAEAFLAAIASGEDPEAAAE